MCLSSLSNRKRFRDHHTVTAVRAGVPLGELREILGHKSLAMVLRYARHCPANISVQVGQRMEGFLAAAGRVTPAPSEHQAAVSE